MNHALLYHDIIAEGLGAESSGFPGPSAAHYKLPHPLFLDHLEAITAAIPNGTSPIITFDDGGASSLLIADELEKRNLRGLFFITTDYIAQPAFLHPEQLRALRNKGHVIGSHSCSHPKRMSHCSGNELDREWGLSVAILSEILGEPVTTASVPGGYYSKRVAWAAEKAGIRDLYTSEPISHQTMVGQCRIIGRYSIVRTTPACLSAKIAAGKLAPRLRQTILWNAKKVAKLAGGQAYLDLRQHLFKLSTSED